jgi:hypothetical protein
MGEFNIVMARDMGLLYGLLKEYLRQGDDIKEMMNGIEKNNMPVHS